MEESLVTAAEPVGETAPVGDDVRGEAPGEQEAVEEPRVLMRLGFNKVLYNTDIHPNGYKPPRPGQTVRHEPKVSLEKQFWICVVVTLAFLVVFAFVVPHGGGDGDTDGWGEHRAERVTGARDCSAAHHASRQGGIVLGGDTIPTSDAEIQNAIGIPASRIGTTAAADDEDHGQLSWANCPVSQDCCEGAETCCTALRPSCVGVPGDKHCCSADDVFCPIGDGNFPVGLPPVGLRPPKGAVATRSIPRSLPGTSAPQCCAGECLSQHYTDKNGLEAEEFYCCTARSCRGWTDETSEAAPVAAVVAVVLLLATAVLFKSRAVRMAVLGSACDQRTASEHSGDGASRAEELEMAPVVECLQVTQDAQPVTVTGIAVGYTPPVVEAVANGDAL